MLRPYRKTVALTYEMADLENAIVCAQMIAEAAATEQFATEADERRAPRAIAAVLTLVVERIRLLQIAMLGSIDPALLWNPRNDAPPEGTEGRGPCLSGWPPPEAKAPKRKTKRTGTRRTPPKT